MNKEWLVGVRFRVREKWLPLCVVTIEAGSIHTAASRGIQEAKKKAGPGRRHIHELTVNAKPANRIAEVK